MIESNIDLESRAKAASKSTWISVVVNIFLSIGQILIGIFSKSQGLVADGIHTLSDLVADFIVLVANRHSQKAPDDAHPYGYLRFENAASFILGLILFIVGVGMLWTATHKILHPEQIQTSILRPYDTDGQFMCCIAFKNTAEQSCKGTIIAIRDIFHFTFPLKSAAKPKHPRLPPVLPLLRKTATAAAFLPPAAEKASARVSTSWRLEILYGHRADQACVCPGKAGSTAHVS